MTKVRKPAVAGRFYPADREELRASVCEHLAAARTPPVPAEVRALVAPHAGYVFSGPVAGSAYAAVADVADEIDLVVLIGPAHYLAVRGLRAPDADVFSTPLGDVPVDSEVMARVLELPGVEVHDGVHAPEHALETQLPFLQEVLTGFRIVPLLVGLATDREVEAVVGAVWRRSTTLLVVSSDLSHYLGYAAARRRDERTADSVERLEPQGVGPDDACGFLPLRALLRLARKRELAVTTLDLRNSGDTGGPRDRVVGYGAFAFHPARVEGVEGDPT